MYNCVAMIGLLRDKSPGKHAEPRGGHGAGRGAKELAKERAKETQETDPGAARGAEQPGEDKILGLIGRRPGPR